ncbi:prostate stem cell antigen-like [Hippocampus zosterae]|uniref:prostate stem cell antigen-like n=1 Tax=Hippocampus zosterae TaxID=109293 RepID=UPI00223D4646|nr:prostate stem cell antigen-like [Hippocampus zosterae]
MNRIVLLLFVVGVCFSLGQALQCYQCSLGLFKLCITKMVTCTEGELCFSGKGKAVGFVDVTMKGCLAKAECDTTTDVNFPSSGNTTIYKMTKTCCDSDLCNGAPTISRGPLILSTIAALLLANMLV